MRVFTRWLRRLVLLAAIVAGQSVVAQSVGGHASSHHLKAELVAESTLPESGKPVMLALKLTPEAGWHGYWQNPGEAGFAPDLKWTLPSGVTVGASRFPVPEKLVVAGLINHVFNGPHAVLIPLNIPAGLAKGSALPIRLNANYLVCTDQICVPESSELVLNLTVGSGQTNHPDSQPPFDQWRAALPLTLDQPAVAQFDQGHVRLRIPYPAAAKLTNPWLFAVSDHVIKSGGKQVVTRDGDTLVIDTEAQDGAVAGPFDAVLSIAPHQGLAIHAVPGAVAARGEAGSLVAILTALGGALLGGLILNIMPCVFPVIGLKALSLARGGGGERHVRQEALAYAAGIILVCLALGGLMLGLRAAGHAVGWAFQLQDPRVILLLLLLVVAITANLAGMFELRSVSAGDHLTRQSGLAGSFWTGALAAFVATPCTGPFMAAALGAALVLPTFAALMIFAGLGLGLALPFLLLGFIPALRTSLPKPGAWMRTFQQIMAIPMALTAAGLLWLLWRQTGVNGLLIGLGVALLALLALWLIGRNQRDGFGVGARNLIQLLVPAAAGVALLSQLPPPATSTTEAGVLGTERFSVARLAELRAAHRPVFVYFTADWCLTCKVNEKAAIQTQAVADAFKAHKIAVLEGDWTNGDTNISRFLEAQHRSGVPLYLFYAVDAPAPQELPQVLTTEELRQLGH